MHETYNGIEIGATSSAEMRTGNKSAIAKTSQVDPDSSHAPAMQFIGDTNHVGRAVTTTKTVEDDGDPVPGDPAIGLIIMNHQSIAVRQVHDPFDGIVFGPPTAKQKRANRLKVRKVESSVWPERWMLADQNEGLIGRSTK